MCLHIYFLLGAVDAANEGYNDDGRWRRPVKCDVIKPTEKLSGSLVNNGHCCCLYAWWNTVKDRTLRLGVVSRGPLFSAEVSWAEWTTARLIARFLPGHVCDVLSNEAFTSVKKQNINPNMKLTHKLFTPMCFCKCLLQMLA